MLKIIEELFGGKKTVNMSHATHSAYSEFSVNEHNGWLVRIMGFNGEVYDTITGSAPTYEMARANAIKAIVNVQDKYKRGK